MSTATEKLKTQNQLNTDFDVSKIFLFDNRFEQVDFENTTGGLLSVLGGTLVGRVSATANLEILKSAAVDGSQTPLGIIANEQVDFAIGETKKVNICIAGDVSEAKVILDGADTLDTLISGRPIRDKINGDTLGIKLVVSDELTGFDNN